MEEINKKDIINLIKSHKRIPITLNEMRNESDSNKIIETDLFTYKSKFAVEDKHMINKINGVSNPLEITERLEGNINKLDKPKKVSFIDKINIVKKLYHFIINKIKERKNKKLYLLEQELLLKNKKQLEADLAEKNTKITDKIITIMGKLNTIDTDEKKIKEREDLIESAKKYNQFKRFQSPTMVDFDIIDEHNNTLNDKNPSINELKVKDNEETRYILKKQDRKV